MRTPTATLFAVLVGLVPMSLSAVADTPDGETPAEETVCDDLDGREYGLCVAYCEATDCDSDDARASEVACDSLYDDYLAASGGEEPPCEASDTGWPGGIEL